MGFPERRNRNPTPGGAWSWPGPSVGAPDYLHFGPPPQLTGRGVPDRAGEGTHLPRKRRWSIFVLIQGVVRKEWGFPAKGLPRPRAGLPESP